MPVELLSESEAYRRRIGRQLNKGEKLHDLRGWLMFGGDGKVRRKQEAAQTKTRQQPRGRRQKQAAPSRLGSRLPPQSASTSLMRLPCILARLAPF